MTKAKGIQQFRDIVFELRDKRKDVAVEDKFGWYVRYWHKNKQV